MPRTLGILTLLALAGTAAIVADDKAPEVTKQQTTAPFAAPLVAITLVSDSEDLILLQGATERALGDRRFLVGKGVDDGATMDWRNNRQVWVAVNDIQQIVEFESVESFRKALEAREEATDAQAASVAGRPTVAPVVSHRGLQTK